MPKRTSDDELALAVRNFYADPLGFVNFAFQWGEPGLLHNFDGPDKWQREFLRDLGEEVRNRAFDGKHPVKPIRMAVGSGRGCGKYLKTSELVMTPQGERRIGDCAVGDLIFGRDGQAHAITGVFPQGVQPLFRVAFSDESSVLAGGPHLWTVTTAADRDRGRPERVVTTDEMREHVYRRYQIPLCKPVEFEPRPLAIDPYVMGYLLGNGSFCTPSAVKVCSYDPDALAEISKRLPEGFSLNGHTNEGRYPHISRGKPTDGSPNVPYRAIEAYGLAGLRSPAKFIPKEYLFNSAAARIDLLRGLMDSDGSIWPKGEDRPGGYTVAYSTSSPRLRDDVIWLVQSLGGVATYTEDKRYLARRISKEGIRTNLPGYNVNVNTPSSVNPFFIRRKAALYEDYVKETKREPIRVVESIQLEEEAEAVCISVNAPDQCYLTNDFIVTHNTALIGWIACWILSTRPHCKITVTANTFPQLQTRTWASIKHWLSQCITGRWFVVTSENVFRVNYRDSWFATAQTCKKENAQAFAGQQAADSSSVYLIDEGSEIPDAITEVAESGLTTGEPMIFMFGNVTRTTGQLYRALFGDDREKWNGRSIDARESSIASQATIAEAIAQYGEDSDYVRVWHRGLAPRASDMQFIDSDRVHEAAERWVEALDDDPLVAGLDVSRGGSGHTVMRFRRGRDARTIPPLDLPGEHTRDTMQLAAWVVEQLNRPFDGRRIDMLFVDSGFGGAVVNRCHTLGYKNVIEVNFSNTAPDFHYYNMRSYMWGKMKDWLLVGAIDGPKDGRFGKLLEADLTGPYFTHRKEQLVLEAKDSMKGRGLSSPDHGDSLCLSFAMNIPPRRSSTTHSKLKPRQLVSAWG
jgi:hypothetical protein